MIRLIHCIKKREDISLEDFRKFWHSSQFDNLLDELNIHIMIVEFKKNLTLNIEINEQLQQQRHSQISFDAVLEIIWQSGAEVEAMQQNPAFNESYDRLESIQQQYIDFEKSTRLFTEYSEE